MIQKERIIYTQPQANATAVKQMQFNIDGCHVKVFFESKSKGSSLEEIKKMILNGMAKV